MSHYASEGQKFISFLLWYITFFFRHAKVKFCSSFATLPFNTRILLV